VVFSNSLISRGLSCPHFPHYLKAQARWSRPAARAPLPSISTIGFKYKDAALAKGPVKVALIKKTPPGTFLLKAPLKDGGPTSVSVAPRRPDGELCDQLHTRDGRRLLWQDRHCDAEPKRLRDIQGVERRCTGWVHQRMQRDN
jgi:hypothetical protein